MTKNFEQYLQESCGGSYSFTDILNNLESTELLEATIDFAETQRGDKVSFGKLELVEFIQRLQKDLR